MPELPEVETVRQILENQLLGKRITNVVVFYPKIIQDIAITDFIDKLQNEVFHTFLRFGKYLVIILTNSSLIVHLRMEGKFYLKKIDEVIDKHEHLMFELDNGLTIRYHDTRKFGRFYYVPETALDKILNHPALKKLGPDANLENDVKGLYQILKKKNVPLKVALLDQTIIAGLGNIYVNEVCFLAKVHPEKLASLITLEEVEKINYYSKHVLDEAINLGGTTVRSYTSSLGVTGRFGQHLKVHNRQGLPCFECKTLIKKIKVGGRGTYYCPVCQKNKIHVIGITGGIATGKSFVSNIIASLGYLVINSDQIVHELLEKKDLIDQISLLFEGVIVNNKIDREKLARIIFNDKEKRMLLEELIHPLVKERIIYDIGLAEENGLKVVFIEVPLLFESGFDSLCDKVIVVKTDLLTNLKRLMARDLIDEEYANRKINAQMPLNEKIAKADYVIDNSFDQETTKKQINKLLKRKW